MKKLIPLLVLSATLMFGITSCKKYEEGPTFSLASKKERVAGDWTFAKATASVDGTSTDITEGLQQGWGTIGFTKDGVFSITTPSGDKIQGTWEFDDKKENLLITIEGESWTWEIIRLKKKELWVKWNLEDTIFEFQFEQ